MRSPRAAARSRRRPSGSAPSMVARPSGASCESSRWRTAAPSSWLLAATFSAPGDVPPPAHGFGPDQAVGLIGAPAPPVPGRSIADRVEAKLTEREAVFDAGRLRAVALEQSAGELSPEQALRVGARDARRPACPAAGGRADDDARDPGAGAARSSDARSSSRRPAGREVGEVARELAEEQVAERVGFALSGEQRTALRALTGPERLAILVGPAGTGKGVVIDAAARAEQNNGREVIGIAVSGSTAERLGRDSPALAGSTMTLDALVSRADQRHRPGRPRHDRGPR